MIGSIAPSVVHSTTPNGAAANLASGGASPVATLSGKLLALASARPAPSFSSRGNSSVKAVFSGKGPAKLSDETSSALSSLSKLGAIALPPAGCKRTCAATARASGALNVSVSGRIGQHGALAFSRSHENSAVKDLRT